MRSDHDDAEASVRLEHFGNNCVCRNASIGSSCDARSAGYQPKNTPTTPENNIASTIHSGSTGSPPGADMTRHAPAGPRSANNGLMRCNNWRAYSITSSARNNMDVGTVSPSAFAVFVFTAISNFTGT